MRPFSILALGLGVLVGACFSSDPKNDDCDLGSEGCGCTGGGLCDPPLVCLSNTCVAEDTTSASDTDTSDSATSATATSTSSSTSAGTTSDTDSASTTSGSTSGVTATSGSTSGPGTSGSGSTGSGSSTGPVGPCGNGNLDDGEECDPAADDPHDKGCDAATCLLENFDCNPLLDQCGAGLKCRDDASNFSCAPSDRQTAVGQPCTTTQQCVTGSFCIGGNIDCNNAQPCCTAWCDESDPQQCTGGLVCKNWWDFSFNVPNGEGLGHLGLCRPP